jgi:COX assembly protein 1
MNARHVPSDDWSGLLKKEEEALITILKEKALVRCKLAQKEYYECVKGRTLSIAWACRESGKKLNECLHEETSEEKLNEAKRKWIKAGKPRVGTENGERIPVTFM